MCAHCLFTRNHPFCGPGRRYWYLHCPSSVHLVLQKEEEVSCLDLEWGWVAQLSMIPRSEKAAGRGRAPVT